MAAAEDPTHVGSRHGWSADEASGRYVAPVTAPEPGDNWGRSREPLAPGASPRVIAASLLDRDRAEFLAEHDSLTERAGGDRDLTELLDMLEHRHGIAALQADPHRFARNVRRAAELITGEPVPDDEPLEVTRARAGA